MLFFLKYVTRVVFFFFLDKKNKLVVSEIGQHLSQLHTEVLMSGTCGHSPSNPTYDNPVKNDKTKQITNLDNNKCQIANLTQQTTTGTSAATGSRQ